MSVPCGQNMLPALTDLSVILSLSMPKHRSSFVHKRVLFICTHARKVFYPTLYYYLLTIIPICYKKASYN